MKRISYIALLFIVSAFISNCFLNPISQAVSETFFPTKENCAGCDEQRAAALASVFQPRANGIQGFGFDLSSSFSTYCAAGVCAGGITENQPNSSVTVAVPNATDLTSLKASFVIPASSKLEVGGVAQVSGSTVQNFTNPVVYRFTDENGVSQNYTITVTPALPADRVNGTVILSGILWTKCSYGQVWRPGFNDCQGIGSAADDFGANLETVFCNTDDSSCDPYGLYEAACHEMQRVLAPPGIPNDVLRPGSFNDLDLLTSCPTYSKGPLCFGSADQCPGNTGSTIDVSLFPNTVNAYYWTSDICSAASVQVIQFGGASNTTSHAKSSKGKALRCMYNLAS
ncbi:glycoside hydrolase xylanase [Leptospira gomenensis]|uniref:Glycoside hydrolase xylanase n=1 Tax=Leptospira gomenensis TaxID=2484974 RepID=A0A5F1YDY4_9LEPT|nr:glycoside hydrolase xylanase [Leptospira gomenensis]TGK34372.1 glycoside hydrolase xylanase [Leptospira gomenensis]TGK37268.1 glycoside hydrolase xylanase [Leptospira gomenensis]TGK50955.1 glycoside hydrolase xylanase [Leptospira gomenensis]TGK56577.1 glycoside hydrolase xylanase [Leptospira gomenensis]